MFQFRRFPTHTYLFSIRYVDIVHVCCHIRKSMDISLVYSSPWLIAVNHVLLRLPVPRHSPCALINLTFMWSSLLTWVKINLYYPLFPLTYTTSQDGSLYTSIISRFVFFFIVQFSRYMLWIKIQISAVIFITAQIWALILLFNCSCFTNHSQITPFRFKRGL